jgi:hypothetical protein
MRSARSVLALTLLVASAAAQSIGIDDLDPVTGTVNAFPFNSTTTGNTSLHVYSVAELRARGLCAGAVLLDIAVSPASGTTGTYNSPQALLQIGHLTVTPPVPGNWTTHLDQPITVHDITSGPYTFPWALDTHTSLPGTQTTAFVWDGVRDFGILYSSSTGVTGAFNTRRTAAQIRHYVTTFNATNQAPTSLAAYAMEVKLDWAPAPGCASKSTYGTGCYDGFVSFHETFPGLVPFDFGGAPGTEQVLRGQPVPSGYLVLPAPSAWRQPTSTPVLNNAAAPVAMADNSISQPLNLPFSFAFPGGNTSVVHAAANGYLLLGATTSNAADTTPTSAELVSQAPRLSPLWCDLNPATNLTINPQAGIYYEIDAGNQEVFVTWLDCADRRGTTPAPGATSVNVQLVLRANGEFEFRYRTITPNPTGTGAVLTGWSPGNISGTASRNPGSIDLSAAIPFATSGPDRTALALDSTFPRLGTTFTMTTSNVPVLVPLAFVFIGDNQLPGLDLGFIGAPGCAAWSNGNLASGTAPVVGTTAALSLPIPNSAGLIGGAFTTQSIAFTLENALNLATSNGLAWTIGN